MNEKKVSAIRRFFGLNKFLNLLYILVIVVSYLLVPYHNIRTGHTNWGMTLWSDVRGPVNVAALTVQRALTFALILFYIYNLRLRRKIRNENLEIDLAIRESEDRRHRVEREYFKLRRQMRDLFDTIDDLVIICSKEYKIEFVNKALKNAFGCGELGHKCYEVLFKRTEVCPWCMADRVFKGEYVSWEHLHTINNHVYRTNSSPFINPDGSVSMISVYHDITRERRMENRLKYSEMYFRAIFENLPIACFGYDSEGKIVAWNKAATGLYGFREEDVLGRPMFDTFARREDSTKTMFIIGEVFKGYPFEGLEWEDRTSDGQLRHVYTSTYPLYDSEGKIIMGISANIDISQQKIIEKQLKTSKEHLERIMETPHTLIVELDNEMKIKMFNKGCERVTGYSREEVVGKNWIELFIPQRLQGAVKVILEGVRYNRDMVHGSYENPILTKPGQEKVIFWSHSSLRGEDGQVNSIIAIGEDVTVRKTAQKRLVDAEKKYRLIADHLPMHLWAIDETGKFILWNKYSEKMLGYTEEEVLGKIGPQQLYANSEEARQVLEIASQEGVFDREVEFSHKDGRKIPVRLIVVPRKSEDKIVEFYGFAEDITKQKDAEKELSMAQERLEAVALKDPLTDLYNNRYVIERLTYEFKRIKHMQSSLSLLLIELDPMTIDESLFQAVRNDVLIEVSHLFKAHLRSSDLLARWGREEFMVILPDVGRSNAVLVAQKIYQACKAKEFKCQDKDFYLGCRIGLASYPQDSVSNSEEMFAVVKKAVEKIKETGKDGVAF